ncbi:Nucleoredoxin [Babesia sp. Xinjiang]|uniref:Nucleoredoxin n=1 Tax=Babesia sp. Xinjiang TaxID=462227 RepID=UPI000A232F54|nr:Nucleoredoxin [Babesia sp. Xinjiang]ORM39634.1 Nucleoredoxin [Babesia sp. Xinjiang]
MGINVLIGHHLCGAVTTHTLLSEKNIIASSLGRKTRYAIVTLIISALIWRELPNPHRSLYTTLGLPTTASQYDIVTLHARSKAEFQKKGSPENLEEVKNAFQLLMNQEKRNRYDRFGDLEHPVINDANLPIVATALAIAYHLLSCIICFAFYRNRQLSLTRHVMSMYSAIAFALEMECRFVKGSTTLKNIYYLNKLLPFQQVELLRGVAPALALLVNMVCVCLFVDLDKMMQFLWHSSVSTNRVILEKMIDVVDATSKHTADAIEKQLTDYVRTLTESTTAHLKTSHENQRNKQIEEYTDGTSSTNNKCHSKNTGDILNIIESMDEAQRQKVANLLKLSASEYNERDKTWKSWIDILKSPILCVALFILMKSAKVPLFHNLFAMETDNSEDQVIGNMLFEEGTLKNQRGEIVPVAQLMGKSVGLLFCDGSSPLCLSTVPFLIQFYNSVNCKGLMQKIEIVYISCDDTREAFEKNIRRMPWLHVDYEDKLLPILRHRYNVIDAATEYGSFNAVEIPSIIVVNNRGNEIQRFPLYHGRDQSAQTLRRWDWRNCIYA